MNCLRSVVFAALFLLPSFAFAQDDPLAGVNALIRSGRAKEARVQLVKAQAEYVAHANPAGEAASWLLLGLTDSALNDADEARRDLQEALTKFTAMKDYFGAWMSVWTLAEIEKREGHNDAAIAAHERSLALLRDAASDDSMLSVETLKILGQVFGAPAEMLGPLTQFPQIVKPLFLQFMGVMARDAYGDMLTEAGQLDKAEALLTEAAAGSAAFGGFFDFSVASHIGDLRRYQWRLDEARQSYLRAIEAVKVLPRVLGQAGPVELNLAGKLAQLEMLSGHIDEALVWNDRALALVRAEDPKREASILEARAELLTSAGRYDVAEALLGDALKLAVANDNLYRQASIHSSLGSLYMFQGRYGSAVNHLEQAIGMFQTLNETLLESTTWVLLAELHMLLETDGSAVAALERARVLAKKSGYKLAEDTVVLMSTMQKMTVGKAAPADMEAALTAWWAFPEAKTLLLAEQAQQVLHEVLREGPGPASASQAKRAGVIEMAPVRTMSLFLKGRMLFERGDHEGALSTWKEALSANLSRDHRAGFLGLIGASYWRQGDREEGIRYFTQSAQAFDLSATDMRVEELLAGYLGSYRRVYYDLLIAMLISQGKPEEAFAQAERARARAFLQLVGNHRFNAEVGADPRLIREAEILRTHIVTQEREVKVAQGTEAAGLTAALGGERQRYQDLMIRVKASNPEYAAVTTVEPLGVQSVRQDLPPGTTMISYFVSLNIVHAWVVDGKQMRYATLPLDRAGLRRVVCWADHFGPREDVRGVERPNDCGEAATAEEAFEKLIAPLVETIHTDKLVLVPHGVLHYVPFAALRNPKTGRDLVEDFTITYAPSASVLRFLKAKETAVDGAALILGDPVSPLPSLKKLPGAAQEAGHIAAMLGTKAHLGAEAREALLYRLGGKTDLVHLAAHGIYDPVNPLFSRIALAEGDGQDGSLTVNDIVSSLDLTGVNLVVLSACRSAAGARSDGDEVVGLTRALLYAGTPGVLSTLWNIDDAAAAGLMEEFYRRLAGGASAAEALRQAQLTIRKTERFSDPKYWAAFTLNGDPQGRWKSAP